MTEPNTKLKVYPQQSQIYNNPNLDEVKRYYKSPGYGIEVPETAITGTYIDKNCPFTGEIKLYGRFINAEVLKMKQIRTIVCVKKYLFYVKKYKRYERRMKKFSVHFPPCFEGVAKVGDTVTCALTRPLSKTKRYVVVSVNKKMIHEKKYKTLDDL
ncbi:40S ribosomal protein S11 [Pseudoloma neurophilia]|uniref:Small ribosomal subunit protein uS17 n=1 Tax=Pseudoloma neurophilia TaxID=146866 RepID=A0A0R0M6W7_9MICR|nr:40S ribosomal protein S11 [Pseudoloma neurophilia]